jgi:phosphoribosylformylglycinamidine (FGAM) synthase-like amidotransferase family enzyme
MLSETPAPIQSGKAPLRGSSPKFGVVVFPGSNCDYDAYYALGKLLGYKTNFLWHKEADLNESEVIVLPGGFSYGDYLRTGSIASKRVYCPV